MILKLTEEQAKEIVLWKYEGKYAIYNYPPWDEIASSGWGIQDPKIREEEFYAIIDNYVLIGYMRLKLYDNYHVLGLGFRPDLIGKGNGHKHMAIIIDKLKSMGVNTVRLDVREFNKRAIKCYENAGFRKIGVMHGKTLQGMAEYIIMELNIT